MRSEPWNVVFLIGFIVYVTIRGVFKRRTKGNQHVINRLDTRGRILMFLVIATSVFIPVLYVHALVAFRGLRSSQVGAMVRCTRDDCSPLAVLAFACRSGAELVPYSPNPQRPSIGHQRRLPSHPPSNVNVRGHLALWDRTSLASGKLACGMVRFRDLCHHVLSSHRSGRTDDVRFFRTGVPRLHGADRASFPAHAATTKMTKTLLNQICGATKDWF